jgi:hypothetical protein
MKVSGETSKWISDHFGISPDGDFVILMRGDGDNRSAVEVKREMASFLRGFEDQTKRKVIAAYDDRQDIVDMYRENGYIAQLLDANGLTPLAPGASFLPEADAALQKPLKLLGVAEILEEAAQTFRERNAVYRDNAVKVGDLMAVLFPHGVTLRTAKDHRAYHLFELMIVKLTRFVNSDLRHQDSIRDLAVYAAMVESLVDQHEIEVRDEWSE